MSTKATPDLELPDGKETRAFAALVQVLKNDVVLQRTVKTFLHSDGSDRDFFTPAFALCPFLEIAPWPTASDWVTEGQHEMPLTIRIMCAVQGTKFKNIGNFWHAIRLAIFPQSSVAAAQAVSNILRGAPTYDLATNYVIKLSAYGATKDEEGQRMMIADGTIQIGLLIPT